MHLVDGMLPAKHAGAWYVVAVLFILKGLQELVIKCREVEGFKALLGLLAAVVFIVSMLPIPVPVAGSSSHPVGTPMAGILVGPFLGTLLGAVALFLQAVLFGHGGLSTLGANIVSMGVAGSMTAFALFHALRRLGVKLLWAAGAAAFIGSLAVYGVTAAQLSWVIGGSFIVNWSVIMAAFLPTQLPLAFFEALITAYLVNYVAMHRPDILVNLKVISKDDKLQLAKGVIS